MNELSEAALIAESAATAAASATVFAGGTSVAGVREIQDEKPILGKVKVKYGRFEQVYLL